MVRFSTAPSESTTTSSACDGERPTSWTERMVARVVGGPDHDGGVGGELREQPVARSSTVSISPWTWSKNWATWRRWLGPSTPGAVRWSTKKR